MMEKYDDTSAFSPAEFGTDLYLPRQCSLLRENEYVLLKENPCKIVEISTSETGELHLVGIDIFTQKKYEDWCRSTDMMDVPRVLKIDHVLVDIELGFLSLMDEYGEVRDDLKLPDGDIGQELSDKMHDDLIVTVLSSMGKDVIVGIKKNGDK